MRKTVRGLDEFDAVLADGLVEPVFQPIVALADGRPVGFEALSRGPKGDLHEASALFAAAAEAGRGPELDRMCVRIAAESFRASDISDLALFVNINPETLAFGLPGDLTRSYAELAQGRDVVIEVTEQSVMRQPSQLLKAVRDSRLLNVWIALDDVGVEPAGVAAMPLVNPDIVKLDRSVVHTAAPSHIVDAVLEEARGQGTQVLAEGIERPEHVAVARSLGATLGQGWLFGRPGPLPRHVQRSTQPLTRVGSRAMSTTTPFELLSMISEVRAVSTAQFAGRAAQVESHAAQAGGPGVFAVNVGDDTYGEAHRRYDYLTSHDLDVVCFGGRLPVHVAGRFRCVPVADTDPLRRERGVLFVGVRDGSGVVARRAAHLGDGSVHTVVSDQADHVIKAMLTLIPRYTA
ncbi:EAL domain, c-di-GMP-specific phosphodiesterase class I (or its enzymatically inactive variant) [Asanoa hainanensis]|uniref:EAL domain, c-di-GMP-specific phosphodiesterase class I (Or its enzymatically inactive variant) n=1 Tax=Asanoa hainanensis TaxID=560556 RepID=A0A239N0A2_9ACTN|nr:EAL domain-containing protein [Asanoa hainanensis]SNT48457.1 EAL domain, c-di-GMP-specific phosphodiesterase class I (or its enzymatically inactive variant) [Asanoa hainanensis]